MPFGLLLAFLRAVPSTQPVSTGQDQLWLMDLNPEIFGHGQGAADAKCFNHQPELQLVETSTISVLKSAHITGNTRPNLTGTLTGLQLQLELLGADLTI
jgi:hypothetical protein